jgi:hypothetical protein
MNLRQLAQKLQRADTAPKLDAAGGVLPRNPAALRSVDFITLPPDVQGTNCGNCLFANLSQRIGDDFFCRNKSIWQYVNERNCCSRWDHHGTLRNGREVAQDAG